MRSVKCFTSEETDFDATTAKRASVRSHRVCVTTKLCLEIIC